MLSEIVCIDYRQDALSVLLGIKNVYLSVEEKKRKSVVDNMDAQEAALMISTIDDNVSNFNLYSS